MLNTPSNPLGTVIPRERMRELAAFAERRGLWIVSDECYDQTVFDDVFVSAAAVADPERTISIYTFSKTYAMTGWRVGYVTRAGARGDRRSRKLQEPLISCVNTPAQYAALAALNGPQAVVGEMLRGVPRAARRGLRAAGPRRRPGAAPAGRVLRLGRRARGGLPSRDFALKLLRERGVAVAPGSAFGANGDGYVRISLATEPAALYEGIDRLVAALSRS